MTVDCRKKNLQAYKTLSIRKYMYNDTEYIMPRTWRPIIFQKCRKKIKLL